MRVYVYLTPCEGVHLPLWDPLDIVVRWVGRLLCHQQGHTLKHLVTIEGGGCHVEEETIQDSLGDVREDILEKQHGDADEYVGEDVGEPCFSYIGDHITCIPVGNPGLRVSKALHMKR